MHIGDDRLNSVRVKPAIEMVLEPSSDSELSYGFLCQVSRLGRSGCITGHVIEYVD